MPPYLDTQAKMVFGWMPRSRARSTNEGSITIPERDTQEANISLRKVHHGRQSRPEPIGRWTARKAAIIVEVMKGQISVPETARKYGFPERLPALGGRISPRRL